MAWFDATHDAGRSRRGPQWSDGYTVDAHYPGPMVLELNPLRLSATAVLHGQPPLPADRPLTWVDLGCGHGLTACMVAAANPGIQVWGFDYNPAHIERARGLARAARLDNCHFIEASFADLAAHDPAAHGPTAHDPATEPPVVPGDVDVFVVNGVYSWIAPDQQAGIVSIIEQRLVPGGLAYVMYESPAGWSSMIPVAEALHLHAAFDGRAGNQAFHDAAAAVVRLAESGARSFPLGPRETSQMESWADSDASLSSHEYLGGHFAPLMFDQVARRMETAKCSFVGSLEATDHISRFWVRPDLADRVRSTNDVVTRELMREIINQQALRRDVFRRGLAWTSRQTVGEWIGALAVTSLARPFDGSPVKTQGGDVSLDATFYEPLVAALAERDLGVAQVLEVHPAWSVDDAAAAISFLVDGGYAAFVHPAGVSAETFAASRRLNQVLVEENRLGANHSAFVAPAIGSAIEVDPLEMSAIGAIWAGAPEDVDVLTRHVLAELDAGGRFVREEGELIRDRDAATEIVRRRVAHALELHRGVFVTLGISAANPTVAT